MPAFIPNTIESIVERLDVQTFCPTGWSLSGITTLDTPCWNWTAYIHYNNGYGYVSFQGRWQSVHRVVYENLKESIPEGLQLDHLCRNRKCANPEHLEPVTQKENINRGLTGYNSLLAEKERQKTHCPHGHEYTEENTIYYKYNKSIKRRCRACDKIWHAKYYAKSKEQKNQ